MILNNYMVQVIYANPRQGSPNVQYHDCADCYAVARKLDAFRGRKDVRSLRVYVLCEEYQNERHVVTGVIRSTRTK